VVIIIVCMVMFVVIVVAVACMLVHGIPPEVYYVQPFSTLYVILYTIGVL